MNRLEAKRNITKTNKLRRDLERLRDRLMREPISGRGFKLCQDKLRSVEKELIEGAEEHKAALKAVLQSNLK
jgi:hypothetical protein